MSKQYCLCLVLFIFLPPPIHSGTEKKLAWIIDMATCGRSLESPGNKSSPIFGNLLHWSFSKSELPKDDTCHINVNKNETKTSKTFLTWNRAVDQTTSTRKNNSNNIVAKMGLFDNLIYLIKRKDCTVIYRLKFIYMNIHIHTYIYTHIYVCIIQQLYALKMHNYINTGS